MPISSNKVNKNHSSAWDRTWPILIIVEGVSNISNGNYSNPSTPLSFNSSHSDDLSSARTSPTFSVEENNNEKLEDSPKIEIRVLGDWSIRSLIATIVQKNKIPIDWSDHALWWPAKKIWLHSMKASLDQYEITANAELRFTPMHKKLRIQLPNHTIETMNVNFSVPVVEAVSRLASELGIRYPEELSLSRPINDKLLRRNSPSAGLSASELQRPPTPSRQLSSTSIRTNSPQTPTLPSPSSTFIRQTSNQTLLSTSAKSTLSFSSSTLNRSISNITVNNENRPRLLRPRNIIERARLNSTWLNSSRSLYEQDVKSWDLLDLRFKYLDFADLDATQDIARINYIYEQLRWSVLNDEIDADDTTIYTLAAISLQVASKSGMLQNGGDRTPSISVTQISHCEYYSTIPTDSGYQSTLIEYNSSPCPPSNGIVNGGHSRGSFSSGTVSPTWATDEQIDSALKGLERSLDKSNASSSPTSSASRSLGWPLYSSTSDNEDLLVIPQLREKLEITTTKGPSGTGTVKRFLGTTNKRNMIVCLKDYFFQAYKYSEGKELTGDLGSPSIALDLRKCEVQQSVHVPQNKFDFIIIEFPDSKKSLNSSTGHTSTIHHLVRCKDEKEYAKWFTACSHAVKGKTMAHPDYKRDLDDNLRLLQIQSSIKPEATKNKKANDNKENNGNYLDLSKNDIDLSDYIPRRILKKKSKDQILQKIQSLHHNYTAKSAQEAQKLYIDTVKRSIYHWDMTLFIIKQINHKKEELLGISPEKISLIDPNTGSTIASYKYQSLYDWKVNWEVKQMSINFRSEDGKKNITLEFDCLSADCKIIHEYIGGYIYMSLRQTSTEKYKGKTQSFDLDTFLKLTGDQQDVEPDHRNGNQENIQPMIRNRS